MSDLEAIIRRLDPARAIAIPEADLTVARRIRLEETPLRSEPSPVHHFPRRFVLRVGAFGLSAVMGVVVLAVTLLPGGPEPIPVAGASQQLLHLATVADSQRALGPGQYAYTSVVEPLTLPAGTFNAYFQGTVQTWAAPNGSGRQVITVDPTPQFANPADQTAWVNAGSPSVGNLPPSPIVRNFGPGQSSFGPGSTFAPVLNVSGLPKNPHVLQSELANGTTNIPTVDSLGPANPNFTPTAGNSCASSACTTFVRAWGLLKGPSVGNSPDIQSSIFQAMATIPGVSALGTITQSGHSGTGFALHDVVPGQTQNCLNGASVTQPPIGSTYQILVDPASGNVVATQVTFSTPTVPRCPELGGTSTSPLLPSFSVVQSSGVVDSPTATPGGSPAT